MIDKKRVAALVATVCISVVCMGANYPFKKSSKSSSNLFPKSTSERLEAMEKQNVALRKQVADLNMRLELLTTRVNSMSGVPGGVAASGVNTFVSGPPANVPGLATVRLKPKPKPRQPNKPKGRLFITGSGEDSALLIEHGAPIPGTNYVPLPDPEITVLRGSGNAASTSAPAPMAAISHAPASSGPVNSKEAASAYNTIKDLHESGRKDENLPLMVSYLKRHSGAAHEDEVAYWLGQYYFDRGDHKKAVEVLKVVTDRHPESEAAPEALYRVGLSCLEMGLTDKAQEALSEVRILYPFSEASEKAEQKLISCCR